jgi:multidrug efflux pump subunit AcrB
MNISAFAIRNPTPVILLFVVLSSLGVFGYFSIPITYFPVIDVPTVSVTITEPAVAPDQMELQITELVENEIVSITGIRHLDSSVSEGRSVTTIEFEIGVPIDRAMSDVRDAVTRVRDRLPALIDEPLIERIETENQPIVVYSVADDTLSQQQLSTFVDKVVVRKIRGLQGVGRVELVGNTDREVQVRLNPDRLDAYGLTANQVSDKIAASQFDLPAGKGTIDSQDKTVATRSAVNSLSGLGAIRLTNTADDSLSVADIGTVRDGTRERTNFARLNGRPVVGFTVYKALRAGDVDVANKVAVAIADLTKANPTMRTQIVDDSVTRTLGNYDSARQTLIEGAILAVAVVFLFLRDWRATIIAAVSLPLSAIPTFWVIEMAGFSLNMLSLLAITLVTGILVDDSIVEIENISRHGRMGKSALNAALDASGEIGLAVIAISAAIIAVFAPVGFMGGEIGQYFRQFGLTVAVAVFFSLLVARLATPLFAAYFMRPGTVSHREGAAIGLYRLLLQYIIAWRWTALALSVALFAAALCLARSLPTEFLPNEDTGRLTVSLELPPGSTLEDSERTSDLVAKTLRRIPSIASVFVRGGSGSGGTPDLRQSIATISLAPLTERAATTAQVQEKVSAALWSVPDIRFEMMNDRGSRAVSFAVLSADGAAASKAAANILREMRGNPVFVNSSSSEPTANPSVELTVSPERAADLGVSAMQVAQAVRVATIGDSDSKLSNFKEDGELIPIRVLLDEEAINRPDKLGQIRIESKTGAMIPLEAVADISSGFSVSTISRRERQRRIEIATDLQPGITQGAGASALMGLVSVRALPSNVEFRPTGDSDTMRNVFTSFAVAMGAGLGLVAIVLILLFGSPLTPLTIMMPLPLAITGVVAALLATGYALSLPVVIGILMLMGIVVKNSIMLVDFAIELERGGLTRETATIEACVERVRPIIMTTLAMIAGMAPAALGQEVGGEFRTPMAVAVIGGLTASTLLSLFVVPAVHVLIENGSDRIKFAALRFLGEGRKHVA